MEVMSLEIAAMRAVISGRSLPMARDLVIYIFLVFIYVLTPFWKNLAIDFMDSRRSRKALV